MMNNGSIGRKRLRKAVTSGHVTHFLNHVDIAQAGSENGTSPQTCQVLHVLPPTDL